MTTTELPYGQTGPGEPAPSVRARCGGPGVCTKCSQEAARPACSDATPEGAR